MKLLKGYSSMNNKPVITIDGPAGAGKSTISRQLAERLCFIYLDTGALYRAVAFNLIRRGYSGNVQELNGLCQDMVVTLQDRAGQLHVFMDDEDVTGKLRTEEIGLLASRVSAMPVVREVLMSVQRDIAKDGGVVAEGRDMGTIVFPEAEIKFFLDASVKERVGRRHRELLGRGEITSRRDIESDMLLRDRQDRERSVAPLRQAHDAIVIDSTDKTISQVVDIMMGIIENIWHNH
jgi:cytidylate kinase